MVGWGVQARIRDWTFEDLSELKIWQVKDGIE